MIKAWIKSNTTNFPFSDPFPWRCIIVSWDQKHCLVCRIENIRLIFDERIKCVRKVEQRMCLKLCNTIDVLKSNSMQGFDGIPECCDRQLMWRMASDHIRSTTASQWYNNNQSTKINCSYFPEHFKKDFKEEFAGLRDWIKSWWSLSLLRLGKWSISPSWDLLLV